MLFMIMKIVGNITDTPMASFGGLTHQANKN